MDLHTHGPSGQGMASGRHLPGEQPVGGYPHRHGKPASWLLVAVIIAAFVAGAFAVLDEAWPLFWVGLAVLVVSVPASRLIGIVRDAVLAGGPSGLSGPITPAFGSVIHPSVDVVPAPAVVAERPAVPS